MSFSHLEVRTEDCTLNIHWAVPMYYRYNPIRDAEVSSGI